MTAGTIPSQVLFGLIPNEIESLSQILEGAASALESRYTTVGPVRGPSATLDYGPLKLMVNWQTGAIPKSDFEDIIGRVPEEAEALNAVIDQQKSWLTLAPLEGVADSIQARVATHLRLRGTLAALSDGYGGGAFYVQSSRFLYSQRQIKDCIKAEFDYLAALHRKHPSPLDQLDTTRLYTVEMRADSASPTDLFTRGLQHIFGFEFGLSVSGLNQAQSVGLLRHLADVAVHKELEMEAGLTLEISGIELTSKSYVKEDTTFLVFEGVYQGVSS